MPTKNWPISPFLDVSFEKFFDSHMLNYIRKLKMIQCNRVDPDCKNEFKPFSPIALALQVLYGKHKKLLCAC